MRWGRMMPRTPRAIPALDAVASHVMARLAVQKALAAEGIEAPFY